MILVDLYFEYAHCRGAGATERLIAKGVYNNVLCKGHSSLKPIDYWKGFISHLYF